MTCKTLGFSVAAALLLICGSVCSVHSAANRTDVTPINWSRFSGATPLDTLTTMTGRLMVNSVKYFMDHYLDSLPDSAGVFRLSAYQDSMHSRMREPATGLALIGMALATNAYDSSLVGRSEAVTRALQAKLARSLVSLYWARGGSFPDLAYNCWQCPLWAAMTGFGAWLVWQDLDTLTQTQVARMMENEANHFNYDPPYCNDCVDDTKAEENAWDAMVITAAVAMMPNHPNTGWWKNRASQWMLSSYARESDLTRNTLVDGKLPSQWITGWNMREEGYVYNHGLMHPDYMCAISMNLYTLLFQSLAGETVPQAGVYNFDVVYQCFVDYAFPVPPFYAPGGAIYRPGKANVYYPQGTDWSSARIDNHFEIDAFASVLPGIPSLVSTPPAAWARIRADTLAWRQSRFTTGQQYAPGEWDLNGQSPWKLGEFLGGFMFGTSYMAMWLKAKDGLMPVGNWNLSVPDTVAPGAPAALTATATGVSTIHLTWPRVVDAGSGTAYYKLFRDGLPLSMTQDTFFTDQNLKSNTVYRYAVLSLDWNNNQSPLSPEASARTPQDTTLPILGKVTVIDSATLLVVFNKEMDSASAADILNYSINGPTVLSAEYFAARNHTRLIVTPMALNTGYILSASGVLDNVVPPHTLAAETRVSFRYDSLSLNLSGYWSFDEFTGTIAYDLSGKDQNGLLNSACSRIPGYAMNSLSLDSNRRGFMALNGQEKGIAIDFPFTLSAWIKVNSAAQPQNILTTEDVNGFYYGTWMEIAAGGQLAVSIGNSGTPSPASRKSMISNGAVAAGAWNHVAAVVKSANDMRLYINGIDAGGTFSGEALSMAHSVYGEFHLGKRVSSGNVELKFQGEMDEVRIYNTALSGASISELADTAVYSGIHEESASVFQPMLQCTPNPFNPTVRIRLSGNLQLAAPEILIFETSGKLVLKIRAIPEVLKSGFTWNAKGAASGIYLVKLNDAGKLIQIRKVSLIR